jgi:hypothetical protein
MNLNPPAANRLIYSIFRTLSLLIIAGFLQMLNAGSAMAACSITFNIANDAGVSSTGSGPTKVYKREFTSSEYANCDPTVNGFRQGISTVQNTFDTTAQNGSNGSSLYVNQETVNQIFWNLPLEQQQPTRYLPNINSTRVLQLHGSYHDYCYSSAICYSPGVPTGASATAGNASASVTFTAPASDGGAAITTQPPPVLVD